VAGYYVDAEFEQLETGEPLKASARFMFADNPIDVLREVLEKEANIERMGALWDRGRDINTGEPLRGEPFLEWLLLPTEEAKRLSLKSRSRPLKRSTLASSTSSVRPPCPSTAMNQTGSATICGGSPAAS